MLRIARKTLRIGALALIAVPASALAAPVTAPQPVQQPTQPEVDEDNEVVCRNLAPKVGTRLPRRRVCLTRYQWREWEENTRELARDTERRGLLRNRP